MALTYQLAHTAWWAQSQEAKDQEWPVVKAIVLFMPALGIGAITEKAVPEVLARIRLFETLRGGLISQGGKDLKIPESIVRSLVGLNTNVTPETWASYSRRMVKHWRDEQPKE